MVRRNISQAKAELSSLIEQACRGEDVVISKAGKPVVKLVPYRGSEKPRAPGALKGMMVVAPDFDALPDEVAEAFGVKR